MDAKEIKGLFLRKKRSGFAVVSMRIGDSVVVTRIPQRKEVFFAEEGRGRKSLIHPRLSPAELLLEG